MQEKFLNQLIDSSAGIKINPSQIWKILVQAKLNFFPGRRQKMLVWECQKGNI